MGWWMCSECDYVFEAELPQETCPECHSKCVYSDVTCYTPECGGPGHLDMRLVGLKAGESKKHIK